MKNALKAVLPLPVRRVLRGGLHYVQRVGRWIIILWQVRGISWRDEWVLLRSAAASPYFSLWQLMAWQDPVLLGDIQVKVRGVGRFRLRAHSDDLWHVLPWREKNLFRFLRKTLDKGDTFIDAGANIGVYTVFAARLVGPGGKIVAVEMMPDTAVQLLENLRINGIDNVVLVQQALSERSGETVTAQVVPGKYGQASISEQKTEKSTRSIQVKTTTLDDIGCELEAVKVIKMDLEGAEEMALRGGQKMLEKVCYVIYESWGRARRQADPVDTLLKASGFVVNQLDGNNWVAVKNEE